MYRLAVKQYFELNQLGKVRGTPLKVSESSAEITVCKVSVKTNPENGGQPVELFACLGKSEVYKYKCLDYL